MADGRLGSWQPDALTRPAHGAGVNTEEGGDPLFARQLPDAYPTWDAFWDTSRA